MALPISQRLFIDGFGILAVVIIGYMFLVDFTLNEGIRHIEYKTEIGLAKEMHETLVPELKISTEHYRIYGKSIPTTEVGGDIIDVHPVDSSLTCYIGDVSGHGVAAGVMMSMYKTTMHMGFSKGESLEDLLNHSNNVLAHLKKPTMFLTTSCIRIDTSYNVEYIVAGHLPILHFDHAQDSVQQLSSGHMPLSIDAEYSYQSKRITVAPGDLIILATDGITEIMDENDEEYGLERLMKSINSVKNKTPDQIFQTLLQSAQAHGQQFDDQTLLVIKVK
jgi:serine phosphatase RsbU (regulator of sigma subunit)